MLNEIFERKSYLEKHLQAPLLEERTGYLQYCFEQGACRQTLKNIAGYTLRIIEYLRLDIHKKGITMAAIEKAALKWAKLEYNHPKMHGFSQTGQRRFKRYAVNWLKWLGRLEELPSVNIDIFNQIFRRNRAIIRHATAPLVKERSEYLRKFINKGISRSSLKSMAEYLLLITEWFHLEVTTGLITVDTIKKAAKEWGCLITDHPKKSQYSPRGEKRFAEYAFNWLKYLDRLEFLPGAATQTSILKEPVMSVSDKPAMPLLKESIPLFTCLFKTRKALQRHINSPLLHERLLYIEHWYKRGAKPNTLRRIAAALLNIMEYLQFYSLRPVTVSELKQAANQWAVRKNIRCNGECSPNACRIFISDATRWFSMLNILEKQDIVQSVFQKQMEQFLDFLIKEKGYSENTRYSYSFILKDFLTGIGKDCDNLMQITPLSIDNIFMEKYTKSSYARVTIRTHGAVIRSFLSYAEEKGWCMEGIAATIKAPRIYTQENIPQSPPWNVIRQILNDCKTHIPSDIRDYAILFLLAVYGLRSSEISRLRLKDIDWKEGLVYLRRAKRSRPQVFPLVQSAGNAILRYLTEVRPENIKSEFVFLRMKAPYTPLSTCAVYMIVNKRLRPFNLSIKHKGPHSLRHGCATHLINEGFSLKEISDHLGHKHIETTRIYAKVDLSKLYLVSDMNWEEVL